MVDNKAFDGLTTVIDLGSHAVKAVVVERRGAVTSLVSVDEEIFQPLSSFPTEAAFQEHQVAVMKTLAARLPIDRSRRVLGLFNHRELQIKLVDLPREVPAEKLEELLSWEAKKLLSPNFRGEPCFFAHRVVRASPLTVALAVIPQSQLRRWHDLLMAGGLPLHAAYPATFAAMAAKAATGPANVPAFSLIDVGQTSTHIQIFAMGDLKFYRNIPAGIAEISARPSDSDWEAFTQKIRFSFDYFRAVTKLGQIDEIRFYGGGARREGFLAYARGYFAPGRVDALDLSGVLDVTPVLNRLGGDRTRLLPFYPALSVDLAAADTEHGVTTDLLRAWFKQQEHEAWERRFRLVPIVGGVVAMAVIGGVFASLCFGARQRLEALTQETKVLRQTIDETRKQLDLRQASAGPGLESFPVGWRAPLRRVFDDPLRASEVLRVISGGKPEGVMLDRFEIRPQGEVQTEDAEGSLFAADDAAAAGDELPLPVGAAAGASAAGAPGATEVVDNVGGDLLVVRGQATNPAPIVAYLDVFRQRRVLTRTRTLQTERRAGKAIRFVLKGALR